VAEYAIYLDHNATSPLRPGAADAMRAAMLRTGNASSVHAHGRASRRLIEDARTHVAQLVGAAPAEVIFTSGGTEANALAIRGAGRRRVLASAVEHVSVLRAIDGIEIIPVDRMGIVDLKALDRMLGVCEEPALVSVMYANNETGVVQPIEAIAGLVLEHDALFHCDAVQAAGRLPLDARGAGVALMTLSAHKLGGPAGIGALVIDSSLPLAPSVRGGGQERGRRAGTENLVGIAGFGAAAQAAACDLAAESDRLATLRDRLEQRLRAVCPSTQVIGASVQRLPNTTCVSMPGVASETQVMAFDLSGVSVSAGAACSSGKVSSSHVLAAMSVGDLIARTAVRVSLGWTTTEADVERFIEVWTRICARMQTRTTAWEQSAVNTDNL
jgi:cysteine desulfurase